MNTRYGMLIFTFFLSVGLLTSCTDNSEDGLTVLDDSEFTENVLSQLSSDIDEVTDGTIAANERFGSGHFFGYGGLGCVTRTVETPEGTDYPKTITLTFGEDCQFNAVEKSGTIIITLTGPPREEGSQRIVTFEEFYVNGNKIEGEKTYTYMGSYTWQMELRNGQITTDEGKVFTREETRTRTMVQGWDTEEFEDDVFEITGSAYGTTAEGKNYTREITQPLQRNRECFWITSGTIETIMDETPILLDFGDGTCDNLAERTVNGETEQIEMKCRIRHMHQWRKNKGN